MAIAGYFIAFNERFIDLSKRRNTHVLKKKNSQWDRQGKVQPTLQQGVLQSRLQQGIFQARLQQGTLQSRLHALFNVSFDLSLEMLLLITHAYTYV